MPTSHVAQLIKQLEQNVEEQSDLQELKISLRKHDAVRLQALAEVYKLSVEELTALLINTVLQDVEQQMPYKPGNKVIRVEDDEPIYEDVGPTPKYLAAQRKLEKLHH